MLLCLVRHNWQAIAVSCYKVFNVFSGLQFELLTFHENFVFSYPVNPGSACHVFKSYYMAEVY